MKGVKQSMHYDRRSYDDPHIDLEIPVVGPRAGMRPREKNGGGR
mgnify:CR=1 FL=1